MKKIYIIRHGQTDFNLQGIVQGRGIDSDLNELGHSQAEAFWQKYKDIPFDKIYTSSLKRTHQSVHKFIEKGLPWQQFTGLDELDWGIFEGKATQTHDSRRHIAALTYQWQQGKLENKFPNGENPLEVKIRQQEAMAEILSQKQENTILICMHGRALRILLCTLIGKPLTKMDEFHHQNLSLYSLNNENEIFAIEKFNDVEHLNSLK